MGKGTNIIVTGGTGYVGSHIINKLRQNYRCIHLGRNFSNICESIIWDGYSELNEDIFKQDIDSIIHCAAIVGTNNKVSQAEYIDINVKTTLYLLQFGQKKMVNNFIYMSTGGVYGFRENEITEENICKPEGIYNLTKYFSELLCNQYSKTLPITILRLFFPYGSYQKDGLINKLIRSVRASKEIELNQNGLPIINPIHIDDVCDMVKIIVDTKKTGIFNVCGNEPLSVMELCERICKELNMDVKFGFNNRNISNMFGSNQKICNELNYNLKLTLSTGLEQVISKIGEVQSFGL